MSDHAYDQPDNHFGDLRPLRQKQRPTVRRNYQETSRSHVTSSRTTDRSNRYTDQRRVARDTTSPSLNVRTHSSHKPLIPAGFFDGELTSSSVASAKKSRKRKLTLPQLILICLAIVSLVGGIYLGIVGWRLNAEEAKAAATLTRIANQENGAMAAAEGNLKGLSTVPISASELADYTVAPDLPRYLIIPKLGVDARVLSVGTASSGALDAPDNVFDTAWYDKSAKPGGPGATLIDGHVSSWTTHGVFYGLKTLQAGDTIELQRGDGTIFTYKVVKAQIYSSTNVNMKAAITPVVNSQPGLNLITCTGDIIPGTSSFNERVIVFATQVSESKLSN